MPFALVCSHLEQTIVHAFLEKTVMIQAQLYLFFNLRNSTPHLREQNNYVLLEKRSADLYSLHRYSPNY